MIARTARSLLRPDIQLEVLAAVVRHELEVRHLLAAVDVDGLRTGRRDVELEDALGGVVGGVGNIFAPGLGGIIGSAISGSSGFGSSGLMNDSMQYLQLQKQMNQEQQAFETASSVLKARHDASMAAIRNIT